MKNKLNKRTMKSVNYKTEEQQEITRFIIILAIVVVLILGFYIFTKYIVKKPKIDVSDEVTAGEINYDVVIAGTMLNKGEKEYYVLAYNNENLNSALYSSLASKYSSKDKALAIYHLDTGNNLNKDYVASNESEVNVNTSTIESLKLGELTLLKIKNKKIEKAITDIEIIKKELNI